MWFIQWIFLLSLWTINFIFIIEAKNSFYSISNFKIESMTYNGSNIKYCYKEQAAEPYYSCILNVTVQINQKDNFIHISTDTSPLIIETDGQSEISTTILYRWNSSSKSIKSNQSYSLNFNSNQIILDFPTDKFVITASLKISCQKGYLQPECIEIDMCQKLNPNVCRNNGLCIQENGAIKCNCSHGFTGYFCDELLDPCQNHICSIHSTCTSDNDAPLKYRCDCNEGYKGLLCGELKYPCTNNFCNNNSTCLVDTTETIGYRCNCKNGYKGQFCALTIDNCANNSSLCSHYVNATCISTKEGHLCYCEGGCKLHSLVTTLPDQMSLPFKWPFSELITFLFVVLEGVVILTLIVLIICLKAGCCSPKERRQKKYSDDHNILVINGNKSKKESVEFGSNYGRQQPIVLEELENNNSINPVYDIHDMQSFGNNQLLLDNSGMSTFGRR